MPPSNTPRRRGQAPQSARLLLQQVADLDENFFLGGRLRRGSGGGRFVFLEHVDRFDHQEDSPRDDDELDQDGDEIAVVQGRRGGGLRGSQVGIARAIEADKQLAEIDFAEDEAERRHDDVVDDGGDDFPESRTDDHTDGEINGVAFGDEGFEFL